MGQKSLGKIGVLLGGVSREREISLLSGQAVYAALQKSGCDVEMIDIVSSQKEVILTQIRSWAIDIAFIALHGNFGEDGGIQSILDNASIMYTGSGVMASQLAFDKVKTQNFFNKNNISIAPYITLQKSTQFNIKDVTTICEGFPLVVKPACEGSSIGIAIVSSEEELQKAIKAAWVFGHSVLIEKFIDGRELTVGILDQTVLPVIEICPKNAFFDFEAKYETGLTTYHVPANISTELSLLLQNTALRSHNMIGCEGFSRVDFIVDSDGGIYVLEINTIPGLTSTSLVPKAAEAAGIDFQTLCQRLIEIAYGKKKTKHKSTVCH